VKLAGPVVSDRWHFSPKQSDTSSWQDKAQPFSLPVQHEQRRVEQLLTALEKKRHFPTKPTPMTLSSDSCSKPARGRHF